MHHSFLHSHNDNFWFIFCFFINYSQTCISFDFCWSLYGCSWLARASQCICRVGIVFSIHDLLYIYLIHFIWPSLSLLEFLCSLNVAILFATMNKWLSSTHYGTYRLFHIIYEYLEAPSQLLMTPHLTSVALWKLVTLLHVSVFQPREDLCHHSMPKFLRSVHFVVLWDTFCHSKWMICKPDLSLYVYIPLEDPYIFEGSISIYKSYIEPSQCILFQCSLILYYEQQFSSFILDFPLNSMESFISYRKIVILSTYSINSSISISSWDGSLVFSLQRKIVQNRHLNGSPW